MIRGYLALFFLLGVGRSVEFTMGARLNVADLAALVLLPFTFRVAMRYFRQPHGWALPILTILYVVGAAIANLHNGQEILIALKGVMKPVLIISYVCLFITLLERQPKGLIYLLLGLLIGSIYAYFRPGEYAEHISAASEYNSYTAMYLPVLSSAAIIIAVFFYAKQPKYAIVTLVALLLISITEAPRGFLLVTFITIGLLMHRTFSKRRKEGVPSISMVTIVKSGLLSLFVLIISFHLYSYAAPNGWLGERQVQKYEMQTSTPLGATPIGLIVAGRTQSVAAMLAIIDNPIIGFGAWNTEGTGRYLVDAMLIAGETSDVRMDAAYYKIAGRAGHSILFGEWMESGIFAAIYWLFVAYTNFWLLLFFYRNNNRLSPWMLFSASSFFLAFLFSPLGVAMRFMVGLYLALYLLLRINPKFRSRFLSYNRCQLSPMRRKLAPIQNFHRNLTK